MTVLTIEIIRSIDWFITSLKMSLQISRNSVYMARSTLAARPFYYILRVVVVPEGRAWANFENFSCHRSFYTFPLQHPVVNEIGVLVEVEHHLTDDEDWKRMTMIADEKTGKERCLRTFYVFTSC